MENKDNSPTVDLTPETEDWPRCFKCERPVKSAGGEDETANSLHWQLPWGVHLTGGTNYGSSIYDAMVDGTMIEIVLCDDCLIKYKHLLHEYKNPSVMLQNLNHGLFAKEDEGEKDE